MFWKWLLIFVCSLVKILYWITQTKTEKNVKAGQCVSNVKIYYNIPKCYKTTKEIISYCLDYKKPIYYGMINNEFHIDYQEFDGMMNHDIIYLALLLEYYGEAQAKLILSDSIELELKEMNWINQKTDRIPIHKYKKIHSENLNEIIETCPFNLDKLSMGWIKPIYGKSLTNIPFTSFNGIMIELQRIWRAPMFRSFFGILKTNQDSVVLYANNFPSSNLITKEISFLNQPILKVRSAAIICNNEEQRKKLIYDCIQLFDSSFIVLVISNLTIFGTSNVYCLQREELLKFKLDSIDLLIIDNGADFNLRSKYAETLFDIKCKYKLILFEEHITNYLKLCGVVELKELVPEIGNFNFIQNNIIRLETIPKMNVLSCIIYELHADLPLLEDADEFCFDEVFFLFLLTYVFLFF